MVQITRYNTALDHASPLWLVKELNVQTFIFMFPKHHSQRQTHNCTQRKRKSTPRYKQTKYTQFVKNSEINLVIGALTPSNPYHVQACLTPKVQIVLPVWVLHTWCGCKRCASAQNNTLHDKKNKKQQECERTVLHCHATMLNIITYVQEVTAQDGLRLEQYECRSSWVLGRRDICASSRYGAPRPSVIAPLEVRQHKDKGPMKTHWKSMMTLIMLSTPEMLGIIAMVLTWLKRRRWRTRHKMKIVLRF